MAPGYQGQLGSFLAAKIVADLRSKFPAEFKDQNDLDYASVIQRALPTPADRRVYFDHLSAGTRPELEHLILASNLDKRRFSMVLSTNFDHLLEMAATDVCQKNLAVYLYNSRFSKADISVHSPKLVKLHGDFLFDDIANLEEEKQRHLNQDMQEKISAALRGTGLIVLGYGGGDKTVMEFLSAEAQKPGSFKNGLWWICHNDGDQAISEVQKLLDIIAKTKEARFVVPTRGEKIYAADFLKAINCHLGWELPERKPFQVVAKRKQKSSEVTFVRGTQSPPMSKAKRASRKISEFLEGDRRFMFVTGNPRRYLGSSAVQRFGRKKVFYFDHRFSSTMIKSELVRDLHEFGALAAISPGNYHSTKELLDRLFDKNVLLFFNQVPSEKDTNYFVGSYLNFLFEDILESAKRARRGKLVFSLCPQATREFQEASGGDPAAIRALAPDPVLRDSYVRRTLARISPTLPFPNELTSSNC